MQIIGLDVGRSSVVACVMADLPDDLQLFIRKYKPIKAEATQQGIDTVAALGDVFALEPTGSYHRIWSENLKAQGKIVLYCSGVRIRNHARDNGILDKSDRSDAAVIARYALHHLSRQNQSAFLTPGNAEVKECFLALKSIHRPRTQLINRLRARLSYELPEQAKATTPDRDWGKPNPPALWRSLAGEQMAAHDTYERRRQATIEASIGRGLSWISRESARLICELDRFEIQVEQEMDKLMDGDATIVRYQPVFEKWDIPRRTQAAIIASVHPIEQFLSSEGKRIIERPWNESGTRTKRDRSLKAFQRAIGCGKLRVQSGDSIKLVSTGDREVRAALVAFLRSKIVVKRQPNLNGLFKVFGKPEQWETWSSKRQEQWKEKHSFGKQTERLMKTRTPWKEKDIIEFVQLYNKSSYNFARLQLFYEYAPQCQNLPAKRRVLKCFPLFVKWLFADLIQVVRD